MTDFYMTPGGTLVNDGSTPANAFDWAGYNNWQTNLCLPGDKLYVGPGTYGATASVTSDRDGDNTGRISVIGVSDLNTLAEAEGTDRPLWSLGGFNIRADNFWRFRNLRLAGITASPLLRADLHAELCNIDAVNSGGLCFQFASSAAVGLRLSAESTTTVAISCGTQTTLLGCIIKDSLIGVQAVGGAARLIGCLVQGCATGFDITVSTGNSAIRSTFYSCATAIAIAAAATRSHILENIIAECTASIVNAGGADLTIIIDGNVWWNSGAPSGFSRGPNALLVDPQFVDPATDDFRVRNEAMRNLGLTLATRGAVSPSIFESGETGISGGTDIDLSSQQLLLADLETVTLENANVINVHRLEETVQEQEPTDGVYLSRNVEFHLPFGDVIYSGIGDGEPAVGMLIVDADANAYVILSVRQPQNSDFWGCITRSSDIVGTLNLDNTVTLYPATYSQDRALGKTTSHATASEDFADVPAKIMLRASDPEAYAGQSQFVERYDIYVDGDIGQVNNGDILKDENSNIYQIVSYRNRDRIDEFSVIECELRRVGP